VTGTETESGEGYLVEDRETAETLFKNFLQKGFQGLYLFSGSPHFFFESIFSLRMDGISLSTITHEVVTLLREGRSIVLFEGASFLTEEKGDALRFFYLLKDQALVSGSCFILYMENTPERWHMFLERELVRVV